MKFSKAYLGLVVMVIFSIFLLFILGYPSPESVAEVAKMAEQAGMKESFAKWQKDHPHPRRIDLWAAKELYESANKIVGISRTGGNKTSEMQAGEDPAYRELLRVVNDHESTVDSAKADGWEPLMTNTQMVVTAIYRKGDEVLLLTKDGLSHYHGCLK